MTAQGRSIYMAKCIACHNSNPKKVGGIGPAVFGSSLDLLEAKVVNQVYPEGYKPQRNTKLMNAFPDLKDKIPAIHAFLNEKKDN